MAFTFEEAALVVGALDTELAMHLVHFWQPFAPPVSMETNSLMMFLILQPCGLHF